jgi:hypothetical protein
MVMAAVPDTQISMDTLVSATKEQVSTALEGQVVILGLSDGIYYGLNEVGVDVWEQLREPIRVADICKRIGEIYDVSADVCQRDILKLLADMSARGLVIVDAQSSI